MQPRPSAETVGPFFPRRRVCIASLCSLRISLGATMTRKDVIVIGGGAAGLFAAIEAGKRGRSVALFERAENVGKKIAISGGGRCNFTNLHTRPENFLSANPDFCRSALARYTPD